MTASTTTPKRTRRLVLCTLLLLASVAPLVRTRTAEAAAPPAPSTASIIGPRAVAPAVTPLPPVDFSTLVAEPVQQWGVVGSGLSDTSPKPQVWDFAEIGNRIYVAGIFTGVRQNGFDPNSPVIPRAYLAAFDRDSGAYIPEFAPVFDRAVYDLAVLPNGNLVAGGEFSQVNGQARTALVALNPTTGATIAGWNTSVSRDWSSARAVIRELVVDGSQLYVVGEFDHVRVGANSYVIFSAFRLTADSGAMDFSWVPRPSGGGVWDIAIDSSRNRVHLVGFFSSINAAPGTALMGTVSSVTALPVAGLTPFQNNNASQTWTWTVAYANDRVFVGGAEHIIHVLDGDTNARLGYNTTGVGCSNFNPATCSPSYVGGGDFQVLEAGSGQVFGGCHCYEPRAGWQSYTGITHYSSITNQRTDNRYAIAYDASTGAPANQFVPGLRAPTWGTWAIFVDSRGCYYVGGDYTRTAAGQWIGGFARMCRAVTPVSTVNAGSVGGSVSLSWTAPSSQLPVARYRVSRDGAFVGETTGTSYTDTGRTSGAQHVYSVEVVDVSNRRSPATTVNVTVSGADTQPPTPPTNVTSAVNGSSVTLNWTAGTDNVAIKGYLVHRDFQYVAFVPAGTTWTDPSAPNGPHRYDVRTQDTSNNLSAPTTVNVTVGAPDTQAPTAPTNVTSSVNGSSVTLNWTAGTDNVAIKGYLVHRDFQYVAFVPAGTTFTDTNVTAGNHRYDIRTQDTSNNNSAPTTINVTVG